MNHDQSTADRGEPSVEGVHPLARGSVVDDRETDFADGSPGQLRGPSDRLVDARLEIERAAAVGRQQESPDDRPIDRDHRTGAERQSVDTDHAAGVRCHG